MRRIRARLIGAFLVVAILPAIPLSIVVRGLLERSLEPAGGEEVRLALAAGLEESREALKAEKESFRAAVEERLSEGTRNGALLDDAGVFDGREEGLVVRRLDRPRLVDRSRRADDPEGPVLAWAEARRQSEARERGEPLGALDPRRVTIDLPAPERVAGYLALVVRTPADGRVLFARRLPASMEERAERIAEAMSLLEGLRVERGAVLRSYVLPFGLVYGALLVLAAIVGSVLAGRIARPIESLARGTRRVAGGDLETRVEVDGQGETRDLQASFNDMVERLAEQRKELARLERKAAWRDLARALAHEIKNPLTPIQLAVQEARDRYPGGDPEYERFLKEACEIVGEEIESLRALVREFSEFARLPEPKPREADLTDTLLELERLYGAGKVVVDAGEGPIAARLDPEEMRRALINLVENGLAACAAAGRKETVTLFARPSGAGVRIEVRDEGCGIAPENIERVFEPSFTTKKGGMGLGLAIVEGIVQAHGGAVSVRSEAGRGTVFAIDIPGRRGERPARESTERSEEKIG